MTQRTDADRADPALAVDPSRSSPQDVAPQALTPSAASPAEDAGPTREMSAWQAICAAIFPNSRSMTREERREFDASAWLNVEPATAAPTERSVAEARLKALTEVHEFYEFDATTEEQFDTWLHERIKEVREQLGIGQPPVAGVQEMDYPSAARVIYLHLADFCDTSLPFPAMIADAARKAAARVAQLEAALRRVCK